MHTRRTTEYSQEKNRPQCCYGPHRHFGKSLRFHLRFSPSSKPCGVRTLARIQWGAPELTRGGYYLAASPWDVVALPQGDSRATRSMSTQLKSSVQVATKAESRSLTRSQKRDRFGMTICRAASGERGRFEKRENRNSQKRQ